MAGKYAAFKFIAEGSGNYQVCIRVLNDTGRVQLGNLVLGSGAFTPVDVDLGRDYPGGVAPSHLLREVSNGRDLLPSLLASKQTVNRLAREAAVARAELLAYSN